LISTSYDKEFVFHDGSRAKNLLELVSRIDFLSDYEFHQFVNHHKNDFANWTEHVLGDKHFADKLRTIPSKHETTLAIREKISNATFGNSIIKIPKVEDPEEIDEVRIVGHVVEHHNISDIPEHSEVEHPVIVEHHEPHHVEPIYKVHPVEHEAKQHEDHEKPSVKHRWLFSRHESKNRESKKVLPEVHHEVEHHETPEKPPVQHRGLFSRRESKKVHAEEHHKHDETDKEDIKESRESKEEVVVKESKTKHNRFQLFSKKNLSEPEIEKIVIAEENKFYPETVLEDEAGQLGRENALWVILYFALVLLIITLLVYRLFL